MPKQKITPKAKYPVQTQKFIHNVSNALEEFEENIQFPDEEIRASAYRVLLEAYRSALTSIWSLAQFANTEQILKTISDRQMTELTTMSKKLEPEPTTSKVSKEPRTVLDLEALTESLKDSSGGLPSVESGAQIASVFSKLADAHRTYAEVTDGLAELSTMLKPVPIHYNFKSGRNANYSNCSSRKPCLPCVSTTPMADGSQYSFRKIRNHKIHETSSITRSRFSRARAGRRKLCNTCFGSSCLFEDRKPIFPTKHHLDWKLQWPSSATSAS